MCTFMENVVGGNKFRSLYSTTNESNTTGCYSATFFIQFIQASFISLLSMLSRPIHLPILHYHYFTFMLTCFISTQKPTSKYVLKALNYDSIDL